MARQSEEMVREDKKDLQGKNSSPKKVLSAGILFGNGICVCRGSTAGIGYSLWAYDGLPCIPADLPGCFFCESAAVSYKNRIF